MIQNKSELQNFTQTSKDNILRDITNKILTIILSQIEQLMSI